MSLLDPKWKYTHSTATDIRKTFARVRREIARKAHAKLIPAKLGPARLKLVSDENSDGRKTPERPVTATLTVQTPVG